MTPTRRVVVTVGMGRWPFDRLVEALDPVCQRHEVFAQIGTSTVTPPCDHQRFVAPDELAARMADADVVITHAGNTVRLVQQQGRVPIAVARDPAHGEMGNDHQIRSLANEYRRGPVVIGEPERLAIQVENHAAEERRLLADRRLSPAADASVVRARLDRLELQAGNPFRHHPVRRYEFAFDQLGGGHGRHLDLGAERGEFLAGLHDRSELQAEGAEPMADYRAEAAARHPDLTMHPVDPRGPLPFGDGEFDSVSMLDVLEHTPDEYRILTETRRVLRPGGALVLTVPARHVFSVLDPDNVKFRFPRVHRAVYRARFGGRAHHERFVDMTDGMRGDLDAERDEHTNYRVDDVVGLLEDTGFDVVLRDGANLFWRLFDVPRLFLTPRWRHLMDRPLRADGRWFHQANLFLVAERRDH